jgi:hypothetical protein
MALPPVSRRAALAGAAGALLAAAAGAAAAARPAAAESMREAGVRNRVTALLACRAHAAELRASVAGGGEAALDADEAAFVARFAAVWLAPGVEAARRIADGGVDVGPGVDGVAAALAVHLGELADERRAGRRAGCVREIDEYVGTVEAALRSDGLARFVRGRRWNGTAWAETRL